MTGRANESRREASGSPVVGEAMASETSRTPCRIRESRARTANVAEAAALHDGRRVALEALEGGECHGRHLRGAGRRKQRGHMA
eukprot:1097507-Prymnesium_polylepis.1